MKPKYIDIHSHMNFAAYDSDREVVIRRALEADVWMINVGTQQDTSSQAVSLSEKYENGLYATVGLHPIHSAKSFHDKDELGDGGKEFTSRGEIFVPEVYRKLSAHKKVVAIGECGLDYYRLDENTKELQKKNFIAQIELANEIQKPLMLHIRHAYTDAYEILKTYARIPANLHFFAGTYDEAKLFLDLGFTFSFTGVITFAREYKEVIQKLPLDRIMSETDCPYVTPIPFRGERNEPAHVREVVKKIADIKNISVEALQEQLVKNAMRFFSLGVAH